MANIAPAPRHLERGVIASQSILWLIVSILLLLAPRYFLGFFGPGITPFGETVAQFFGAELSGFALASWFTRNVESVAVIRRLVSSYIVCNFLGFLVSLTGTLSGRLNSHAWLLVALYLGYALMFSYLCFAKTESAPF